MQQTYTQALTPGGRPLSLVGPEKVPLQQNAYNGNGWLVKSQPAGLAPRVATPNQYGMPVSSGIEGTSLMTQTTYDAALHPETVVAPGGLTCSTPADNLGRVPTVSLNGTPVMGRDFASGADANPYLVTKIKDIEGGAGPVTAILDRNAAYQPLHVETTGVSMLIDPEYPEFGYEERPISAWAEYDLDGFMGVLKNNWQKPTTAHRTPDGRVNSVTDEDGYGSSIQYQKSGFVTSTTDERGKVTRHLYAPDTGWHERTRYPDGHGVVYGDFDAVGNPGEARFGYLLEDGQLSDNDEWPSVTYHYTYDAMNRKKTESDPEVPRSRLVGHSSLEMSEPKGDDVLSCLMVSYCWWIGQEAG